MNQAARGMSASMNPPNMVTSMVSCIARGRRWSRLWRLLLGACVLASIPQFVAAQWQRFTGPVLLPASAHVLHDDAFAAEVNPALVGLLPTWSLGYVHTEVDRERGAWARGDALHLAMPLPFGFGAALSLGYVRPTGDSAVPEQEATRSLATFTGGFRASSRFALGVTARGVSSRSATLDGLSSLDVGAVLRLGSALETSLVVRDLFLSREGFGLALWQARPAVHWGLQVLPLGTSSLVLDGILALDGDFEVAGRGALGVALPRLGQWSVAGEVQWAEQGKRRYALLTEWSLTFGQGTLGAGVLGGDGFGRDLDGYALVRLEGRPRLDRAFSSAPQVVLDVQLEGVTARSFLSLSQLLGRARRDPRVAGVLLRPQGSGLGLALAQELRAELADLERGGKWTGCFLQNASGSEYYACAGTKAVWLDPAGSVRLMGQSMAVLMFGDVLRKLQLRADFLRIGDHKSAPEQFVRGRMGEAARAQLDSLLDDAARRMRADLAKDRGQTRGRVQRWVDEGPHISSRALGADMISGVLDRSELGSPRSGVLADWPLRGELPRPYPKRFAGGAKVGVVLVDGGIVDGESVDVPLLGVHSSGGQSIVAAVDALAADPTVGAIVVRVDSPGGAVMASDQIWRAIYRARQRKPVVASMGAVAASGGYYVASAAHEVWANPSTITGSIGIFYGKIDVRGLADALGVGVEVLQRGAHAGADSAFRAFTAQERAALAENLRAYYRLFLARVAEGRGMAVTAVDKVARGQVFSGETAQQKGLVDRLGGFGAALARARELAKLGPDADVVVRPAGGGGLLATLLAGAAAPVTPLGLAQAPVPDALRHAVLTLWTLQAVGSGQAMALLPYDIVF